MTRLVNHFGSLSLSTPLRSTDCARWFRVLSLLAVAFLIILLPACDSTGSDTSDDSPQKGIDLTQQAGTGIHAQFAEVAQRIPDFGGFFLNSDGQPVVYLRDPAPERTDEVRTALRETFGEDVLSQEDNPRRTTDTPELQLREGRYRMEDLLTWYDRLPEVLGVEGVVLIDLHEQANNLTVGVQSLEQSGPKVEEKLQQIDIPREAVEIIDAELPSPYGHGLRSNLRPTRGGVEIGQAGSNTVCTMGFNVSYRGDFGFLTNSHCTNQRGSASGTRFTISATGGRVGREQNDPGYNTCYLGFSCRWSDAAFVDYNSGTGGYNQIARPRNWAAPNSGSSSLQLNHGSAGMKVDGLDAHPVSGQMIDKVGRTTGWTYGFVNRTCYPTFVSNGSGGRVKVNGKPVIMRCQYGADYTSSGGDSGSPVFDWHGDSVTIWGLNWGGGPNNAVFSPWKGIAKDL